METKRRGLSLKVAYSGDEISFLFPLCFHCDKKLFSPDRSLRLIKPQHGKTRGGDLFPWHRSGEIMQKRGGGEQTAQQIAKMHFTTTGAMGMGKEEDKFSSSLRERVGGAVKKYREK